MNVSFASVVIPIKNKFTIGAYFHEPLTNEVIRRVLELVNPAELRGTILAVPVANPLAFQALTGLALYLLLR